MTYSFEKTSVRPDPNIPFWTWSTTEISNHITNAYINTGKLESLNIIEEHEFLEKKTYIFKDKPSFNEFNTDPLISPEWPKRNKYNADNNIVVIRTEL